jgi:hypothetical protein
MPIILRNAIPDSKRDLKCLWPELLATLLVVVFGALDDWYYRFDYMADAMSYLDISDAIRAGHWSLALSPYWSIGYPFLVAIARGLFPDGPQGEWMAVHAANLVVFVTTYLSFVYLLKVAQAHLARAGCEEATGASSIFVLTIGTAFFLLFQLLIGAAARVNPDLLVSGVFFLGTALALRLSIDPRPRTAVLFGLVLGVGYVVKAIFLPLAAFLVLVVLLSGLAHGRAERSVAISQLALALTAMAILVVPYVAAISFSAGSFTLGETGNLNYAWNVNHVPSDIHWQGGPGDAGQPLHPTQMVLESPHVFVFSEPFHVTYPPWFNPFYWYQGVRHPFHLENEIAAVKANLAFLMRLFLRGARGMPALFLLALGFLFLRQWRSWWRRMLSLWPVVVPSLVAIGGYVLVVVETRYVTGFFVVLFTAPFVALFAPTPLLSRRGCQAVVALVALICAMLVCANEMGTWGRAIRHESYLSDDEWRTGLYLSGLGIHPGDKVAAVNCGMICTWARVSGAHVVAEIPDLVESAVPPDVGTHDLHLFVSDPAVQQTVLALFKQAGATMVVLLSQTEPVQGPGWEQVPGTDYWVRQIQ